MKRSEGSKVSGSNARFEIAQTQTCPKFEHRKQITKEGDNCTRSRFRDVELARLKDAGCVAGYLARGIRVEGARLGI